MATKRRGVASCMMTAVTLAGLVGCSSCVVYLGGCQWGGESGQEKYERAQELSGSMVGFGALWAQTENGSIGAVGEATSGCRVKATITGRSFTVEAAQALAEATEVSLVAEGTRMKVAIDKPKTERGESVSVSLEITVPRETAVELHSTNGRIAAENLARAAAYTSNGSITLKAIGGDVTGHTTNGDVRLSGVVAGQIDLRSSNGSLYGEGVMGSLNASTTNGSVHMAYAPEAAGDMTIDISTTNGNIGLAVPQHYSAHVDASTVNGKIHTDLPVTVSGTIGKSINGTIGTGEGRLKLRTTNGSITLKGAN